MAIPATSIDEVILELDDIIQKCIVNNSKLGLFAALYKKVTVNVRQGITTNRFQDGARMELLDVVFANRYLEAYKEHAENRQVTNAWKVTFEAAEKNNMLIIQHLLAGMNAHISLDLGIATAHVAKQKQIKDLEHDFNEINILLGNLIEGVQNALSGTSPVLSTLDWVAGKMDEKLARFNLELFRKRAWEIAASIHVLDDTAQSVYIDRLDKNIKTENVIFTKIGSMLLTPGLKFLAKYQNQKTAAVIKALNSL